MYFAFFGGIAGGGALYAINAKRLGMQEELRRIVVGTIVLTVLSSVVAAWVVTQSDGDRTEMRANGRLVRFAAIAVALLFAKWVAKRQQPSYEAYDYSDRPKGKLWPYGLGALLFGGVVHGAVFVVALFALRAAQGAAR